VLKRLAFFAASHCTCHVKLFKKPPLADRIRIRQGHDEQSHFRQFTIQPHIGEPEVDLGFTGWVRERQEYFAIRLLPRSNRILDDRFATCIVI
jgi:hypothetical protein